MSSLKEDRLPPCSAAARRKYRALVQHPPRGWKDSIVAVETKTAECFVGRTTLEALRKGRKRHPKGLFAFLRAGHPFTQRMKRGHR